MYRLSKRSLERLEGVNPILVEIIKEAISYSPYDFGIPPFGGRRTEEEQLYLFNKGASKCDGYKKRSFHQSGNAFDIYAYVDGKATWDKKYYKPIAEHVLNIAKNRGINLIWGGSWLWKDYPHFEYRG